MRLANALPLRSRGSIRSIAGAATLLLLAPLGPAAARADVLPPLFAAPVPDDVASNPVSVAVADLNGDGNLDLVTAGSQLTLLFGNGAGLFGGRVDDTLPGYGRAVAVTDLDGDGDVDLAVATATAGVLIFLNPGNGTFGPGVAYAAGSYPTTLAIADLDGDHVLDLVVVNSENPSVSVLLGNGDGTFKSHVDYPSGTSSSKLAVGDLNGDGRPDLAVTNLSGFVAPSVIGEATTSDPWSPSVAVLLNAGQGTFAPPVEYTPSLFPTDVAIGDFTGDGVPDLVETDSYPYCACGTIVVLPGIGDGTFGTAIPGGNNLVGYPLGLAATDLDGDGKLDLAVGENSVDIGYVDILLGKGDGTFTLHERPPVGYGAGSLALRDVNGDGRPDLITANAYSNTAAVAIGSGDAVAVLAALVSADAEPGRVTLRWQVDAEAGSALVSRRTRTTEWATLGTAALEVNGSLSYADATVEPGLEYGYRLELPVGGSTVLTGEAWVTVPGGNELVLEGARPNPAVAGLTVAFSLTDEAPARLDVFDVAGRQVLSRALQGLGAGRHVVALDREAPLAPGVYLLRLTHGSRSLVQRAIVLR